VRASFANKHNSSAEDWGLGAQCLRAKPELYPCVRKTKTKNEHKLSFSSAVQNSIPVFKKTDLHHVSHRPVEKKSKGRKNYS
jgi:hypothetical protein